MRNKEYTNNKFKHQGGERIQINSAEEMCHRVVGGVVFPRPGLHDAGSRGQQREVVSVGRHVLIRELDSPTQSGCRGLGRGRIPVGTPPSPDVKASCAADKGTRSSCREGMPQTTSPNCDEVGSGGSFR